ncbi:MAG: hypothetical protein ACI376_06005 [Candidatus Bruticola sp.]
MLKRIATFAAVVGILGTMTSVARADGDQIIEMQRPEISEQTSSCYYYIDSHVGVSDLDSCSSCSFTVDQGIQGSKADSQQKSFYSNCVRIFLSHQDKDEARLPEAKQVKEKYRPQMLQLEASLKELKVRVAKELSSPNPNKVVVKNYMNQISELHRRRQQLFADQMFETLEMLPKEKKRDYLEPIIERYLR